MAQAKQFVSAFLALCLVAAGASAWADRAAAIGEIPIAALPGEARAVLALIKAGGPFAYAKDGSVFGNRERLLPPRSRGYYREYTVPTPGARDRGARRIVAGSGASGDVRTSGEYYYSNDHYNSFRRIRE
ncbi:MAG: ribonuclease [Burkholderiales bacterium]|nr:ribonuclease [Burkholderiales bacterium]